jgi:deoxycytidine triphosphate deaminase
MPESRTEEGRSALVLARNEICERLVSPNAERQIFRPGSWELSGVRGAAYDLRIAPDFLIVPDGTRYWRDAPEPYREREAAFPLKRGDGAFVSSIEQLSMPWDLAGNIAPKFRFALDGLLIMGGMLVDPGYGRVRLDDGTWVPKPDGARLHFQIANIGAETIWITPREDSIAAIQLVALEGDPRREIRDGVEQAVADLKVPSSDRLLQNLFYPGADEPFEPLAFFSSTAGLRERIEDLNTRVEKSKARIEAGERSTDRLVVFGVFLIAITLFSVATAAILGLISDGDGNISGKGLVVALLFVIVGVGAWKIVLATTSVFDSLRRDRSAST